MSNFDKAGSLFFFHFDLKTKELKEYIRYHYITPKGKLGINFWSFGRNGLKTTRLGQFEFRRKYLTCRMVTNKENYYKDKANFLRNVLKFIDLGIPTRLQVIEDIKKCDLRGINLDRNNFPIHSPSKGGRYRFNENYPVSLELLRNLILYSKFESLDPVVVINRTQKQALEIYEYRQNGFWDINHSKPNVCVVLGGELCVNELEAIYALARKR